MIKIKKQLSIRDAIRVTILSAIIALIACTGSSIVTAEPNTPFQLKIEQSAQIESVDLTVGFHSLVEDSRCPEDVNCAEAGRARILVDISSGDAMPNEYELTLSHIESDAKATTPDGYTITFLELDPYPNTTKPSELDDYVATFVVATR